MEKGGFEVIQREWAQEAAPPLVLGDQRKNQDY